ncbi:hypothetical protein [Amycolatopsis sp. H20-H5]|uniref:hypothetical protein n=1 Tax=Amycolatopsis sp. H20-H5 TaxID=3046309 RepID=UPI002DB6F579|nr:hypothetical protein [Amycolatopsis sp. H20-H5]MEC3977341.1 hypothetical protein [Amycolatopsis sp. H20-H5]
MDPEVVGTADQIIANYRDKVNVLRAGFAELEKEHGREGATFALVQQMLGRVDVTDPAAIAGEYTLLLAVAVAQLPAPVPEED